MTYALIAISLFAIWNWWRKRVYYRQYQLAINLHTQKAVNEWAKLWASGYREQLRDEWPEEIERR